MLTQYKYQKTRKRKEVPISLHTMIEDFMTSSEIIERPEEIKKILLECLVYYSDKLTIKHFPLTDDNLINSLVPFLNRNPQIKNINFSYVETTDEGISYMANNCSLESVDLSNTNTDSKGIISLSKMEKLTKLDVSETSFDETSENRAEVFKSLSQSNIRDLSMNSMGLTSSVDDGDIKVLISGKNLKRLSVVYNKLSGIGFRKLKDNTVLEYLDVRYNPLTDKGIEYIERANVAEVIRDSRRKKHAI